jgi:hypothetical protein
MKVSNMTDHIKELVEQGGGVFVTQYVAGAFEIFPYKPTAKVRIEFAGDKGYSYKFIEDSVAAGKLLRPDDYEMKRIVAAKAASPVATPPVRAKRPREEPQEAAEVEPTPKKRPKIAVKTPLKVTPAASPPVEEAKSEPKKSSPTRSFYKVEDEVRMQQYVAHNPGSTKSLSYWKQALVAGLPVYHTAESLKFHWAKVISERLAKGLPATKQSPKSSKQASPMVRYQSSSFSPEEVKEVPEHFKTPGRSIIKSIESSRSSKKKVRISPSKGASPYTHMRYQEFSPALSASPSSRGYPSPVKGLVSLASESTKLSQRFQDIIDFKISAKADGTREVRNMTDLRVKCVQAGIPERFLSLVQRCRVKSGVKVPESEVLRILMLNKGKELQTEAYFAQRRS